MMRKVSFKGLRFSFSRKTRDKRREKSPVLDGVRVDASSETSAGENYTTQVSLQVPAQGDEEPSNENKNNQEGSESAAPVQSGDIQLPRRKEKHGFFGTLRQKIRNGFPKKHDGILGEENGGIIIGTGGRVRNRKSKKKTKHSGTRCVVRPVEKPVPSNTSDEISEGVSNISVHAAAPRSTRSHIQVSSGTEKRETHSSCSSDSCEHDNSGVRCSKVSVNVHSYEEGKEQTHEKSNHGHKGNISPSVSALRKVNYSSPSCRLLCSGLNSSLPNYHSPPNSANSDGSDSTDSRPTVPPRLDLVRPLSQLPVSNVSRSGGIVGLSIFEPCDYEMSSHSPLYDEVKDAPKIWSLTTELLKLSKFGWYWGPLNRVEAEEKLSFQPNGAFLVRDSSDDRYLLSLSFRSNERTLHTRIEHCNGMFSFYAQPELEGYSSIVDLIEHSMNDSLSGVFCYSRARTPGMPSFPVRLTKPVSRFTQVRSLQYLCRFVIRNYTRLDHIQKLPLPNQIKGWLEQNQYN